MSSWVVAWLVAGLVFNLVSFALALSPVQAAVRLRACAVPGKAAGWLDARAVAAWRVDVRCAGVWVAGAGSLLLQGPARRLRVRVRAGIGPFPLPGPRRLQWAATGLPRPSPGAEGLPRRAPGLLRRPIQSLAARWRQPGAGPAALRALTSTLAPRTGWRRLKGQLELGFADAMATALAAAAVQSGLLAGLARAGLRPAAVPGALRVVPRFGRPAAALRVDAAAAVRVLWLMLAAIRAAWAVVRPPRQAAAPGPCPGRPGAGLFRPGPRGAGWPLPVPWRMWRRARRPQRARASRAFA